MLLTSTCTYLNTAGWMLFWTASVLPVFPFPLACVFLLESSHWVLVMSNESGTICRFFQPWLQLSCPAFLRWRQVLCWGNNNFFLQYCGLVLLASICSCAQSEAYLSALPCLLVFLRTARLSIPCIVKNGTTAYGKSSLLSLLENAMHFWHDWYCWYSINIFSSHWVTVWFAQVIADKDYMSGEQVLELLWLFYP